MTIENLYCDRCKKLIKAGYRSNRGFHLYKRKFLVCRITDDEIMDLCQDCYDSLRDWIKGKESEDK